MSETVSLWESGAPLPPGRPLLIEASAGTGKTWQMAHLVTRLVAELDLPIHEILVITFTKAAAAELRDRVRRRLTEARAALGAEQAPEDPALAALWQDAAARGLRRARLAAALSDFDRAPISTIHGFCQRTLEQLAFASGQEPGLELLAEAAPLLSEYVDDCLARLYTRLDEDELVALSDMGLRRAGLADIAESASEAVAPELVPPPAEGDPVEALAATFARWRQEAREVLDWLDNGEGHESCEILLAELNAKKSVLINRQKMAPRYFEPRLETLRLWLEEGSLRPRYTRAGDELPRDKLDVATFDAAWRSDTSPDSFPGRRLFEAVETLFIQRDREVGALRAAFAAGARAHVDKELRRRGLLTYDSMLSRLAERIQAPDEGPGGPLAEAIRERFQAALVDEFQDTDGAQWAVLQAVFVHESRRLLVVGDPKQAIYAFRGADVHVYLDAARQAERFTMGTNWRSDGPYVEAMNALWQPGSQAFDLKGVDYVQVSAQPSNEAWRLLDAPPIRDRDRDRPRRALELRWLDGGVRGAPGEAIGNKAEAQVLAARACAREAARLVSEGTRLAHKRGPRPLSPGDIAVLVRTHRQGEQVRQALQAWGLPSVSGRRDSVFDSPAADWLLAFLDALAEPGRDAPARTLATTPLFGWTAAALARSLAAAGAAPPEPEEGKATPDWAAWIEDIAGWAGRWPTQGFVRVFEKALDRHEGMAHLLAAPDGERHATDLRHLVELCHAEERRRRPAPRTLARWLRDQATAAGQSGEEASLRLESDADAVSIVTVHKSKGLEYPVVLLPYAWESGGGRDGGQPLRHHDIEGSDSGLRLDLHPAGAKARAAAMKAVAAESSQEKLRLLYVALTRAAHHAVAWLGPLGSDLASNPWASPLGRVVARQAPEGEMTAPLDALVDRASECIGWSPEAPLDKPERLRLDGGAAPAIQARAWPSEKHLGSAWMVASYSSLSGGRGHDEDEPSRADEEREAALRADLGAGPTGQSPATALEEPTTEAASALDAPAGLAELGRGTELGTWVHGVLEHLDFPSGQPKEGEDLAALVAREASKAGVRGDERLAGLPLALPAILDTPLDGAGSGLPPDFCLRQLGAGDRLDELAFQLKLGAGNRYTHGQGKLFPAAARVALQARDAGWPGAAWLDHVLSSRGTETEEGLFPPIAGILTGFIDLTFRVKDEAGERYYVADYKTNRIAPRGGGDSLLRHYTQPWLAWAMGHAGYHLQSLIYTVALHRFLRERLREADYDYDRHVGGHLYLFLRGMQGAEATPDGNLALGVYHDRWPRAVVLGLDAALDGATPERVADIVAGGPSQEGGA